MSSSENSASVPRTAVIHRMVMRYHVCPFGIMAKDVLSRAGYVVDNRHLTTREATETFKKNYGVETTPQIFINGKRIGGYADLLKFLDIPEGDAASTNN